MIQKFQPKIYPQINFVIGDFRDKYRLLEVSDGVDYIIHTAAMMDVRTAGQNSRCMY